MKLELTSEMKDWNRRIVKEIELVKIEKREEREAKERDKFKKF